MPLYKKIKINKGEFVLFQKYAKSKQTLLYLS